MMGRVLNILGTVIILGIILISIPFLVPKIMGYHVYDVISGSMEPEYPKGCLVLVKPLEPAQVQEGDVITFQVSSASDAVTTHRVVPTADRTQSRWPFSGWWERLCLRFLFWEIMPDLSVPHREL